MLTPENISDEQEEDEDLFEHQLEDINLENIDVEAAAEPEDGLVEVEEELELFHEIDPVIQEAVEEVVENIHADMLIVHHGDSDDDDDYHDPDDSVHDPIPEVSYDTTLPGYHSVSLYFCACRIML